MSNPYPVDPNAQQGMPQGYGQQAPVVVHVHQEHTGGNGVATAAMILGIVGFVFALFPLIGIFIAMPCTILAFILGIVGIILATKSHRGMGMAIAGLVLSIIVSIMMMLGGGWLW